ncbi:MAG: hypothetical protein HN561_00245 [Candidatus Scalindua sp.]|jgi:hypothetical protein|nr:hypothetical protein [Candidatus Scalindua sp.]
MSVFITFRINPEYGIKSRFNKIIDWEHREDALLDTDKHCLKDKRKKSWKYDS